MAETVRSADLNQTQFYLSGVTLHINYRGMPNEFIVVAATDALFRHYNINGAEVAWSVESRPQKTLASNDAYYIYIAAPKGGGYAKLTFYTEEKTASASGYIEDAEYYYFKVGELTASKFAGSEDLVARGLRSEYFGNESVNGNKIIGRMSSASGNSFIDWDCDSFQFGDPKSNFYFQWNIEAGVATLKGIFILDSHGQTVDIGSFLGGDGITDSFMDALNENLNLSNVFRLDEVNVQVAKGGLDLGGGLRVYKKQADSTLKVMASIDGDGNITGESLTVSEKVTAKDVEVSEKVTAKEAEIANKTKTKEVEAETINVSDTSTTLNLLVQQLATIYKLDVTHTAQIVTLILSGYLTSDSFVDDFTGHGFRLWKDDDLDWNLTLDKLTVRKTMTIFELIIQQIRSINGALVISQSNGKIKSVLESGDNYILTFDSEYPTFVVNDMLRHQVFTGSGVKYYWVEVSAVDNKGNVTIAKSEFDGVVPAVNDEIVQMGNTKNTSRQSLIYLSAAENGKPIIDILDGVNKKNFTGNIKCRLGSLSDIQDEVLGSLSGYGLYSNNVYLRGKFVLSSGKTVENEIQDKVDSVNVDNTNYIGDALNFSKTRSSYTEAHKDVYYSFFDKSAFMSLLEKHRTCILSADFDIEYSGAGDGDAYVCFYLTEETSGTSGAYAVVKIEVNKESFNGRKYISYTLPEGKKVGNVFWTLATIRNNCKGSISKPKISFGNNDYEFSISANEANISALNAKSLADTAQESANVANGILTEISADDKLTESEKIQVQAEWGIIEDEYPGILAKGNVYSVSTDTYLTAYNSLSDYIVPLLSFQGTSSIVRDTFNSKFATYYTQRTTLLNAIYDVIKGVADDAQNSASSAQSDLDTYKTLVATSFDDISNSLSDLQSQFDGKIVIWGGEDEPTLNNYPADTWIKEDGSNDYDAHIGNVYNRTYENNSGVIVTETYKFSLYQNTYQWILVTDSLAAEAYQKVTETLQIVNTKNRVSYGATPDLPCSVNDFWIKTDGSLYICNVAGTTYVPNNWQLTNDAAVRLNALANDNIISKEEKVTLRDTWSQIQKEYLSYASDATTYSVSISTLLSKYNALSDILNNVVKIGETTATDTTLSASQKTAYNTAFSEYYVERSRFANTVADKIAGNKVDSIEIGGVNLLSRLNWKQGAYLTASGSYNSSIKTYICSDYSINIVGGENYILQRESDDENNSIQILFYADDIYLNSSAISVKKGNLFIATPQTATLAKFNYRNSDGSNITPSAIENDKVGFYKGNKPTAWTQSPEDTKADYTSVADSIATTKANLAEQSANATTEEARQALQSSINALDEAKANADDVYSKSIADGLISASEQRALDAAEDYAIAAKNLAITTSNAYADGVVSEEEARAIADAQAKLNEAKSYAESTAKDAVDSIQVGTVNLLSRLNWKQGAYLTATGLYNSDIKTYICSDYSINIVGGENYILQRESDDENNSIQILFYADDIYLSSAVTSVKKGNLFIVTPQTATLAKFNYRNSDGSNITPSAIENDKVGFYKGNKATAWSPSQADIDSAISSAQTSADNANSVIDAMNDDTIFDITEKYSIREEWYKISGMLTTTGTPSGSGSYTYTYNLVSSIGGLTLQLAKIAAAYASIRTYLNNIGLNSNDNTPDFSRSGLADAFAIYYKAEKEVLDSVNQKRDSNLSTEIGTKVAQSEYNSFLEANESQFLSVQSRTDYLEGLGFKALNLTSSDIKKGYGLGTSSIESATGGESYESMLIRYTGSYASFATPLFYNGGKQFSVYYNYGSSLSSLTKCIVLGFDSNKKYLGKTNGYISVTGSVNINYTDTQAKNWKYFAISIEYQTGVTDHLPYLTVKTCFSTETYDSRIEQSTEKILLQVGECGVDIDNKGIELKGNTKVTIGTKTAGVFTTDDNGNPVFQADLIDAGKLKVSTLQFKFNAISGTTYTLTSTSPSNIDGTGKKIILPCTEAFVGTVVTVFNMNKFVDSRGFDSTYPHLKCTFLECANGIYGALTEEETKTMVASFEEGWGVMPGTDLFYLDNVTGLKTTVISDYMKASQGMNWSLTKKKMAFYNGSVQLICVKEYDRVITVNSSGQYVATTTTVIRWRILTQVCSLQNFINLSSQEIGPKSGNYIHKVIDESKFDISYSSSGTLSTYYDAMYKTYTQTAEANIINPYAKKVVYSGQSGIVYLPVLYNPNQVIILETNAYLALRTGVGDYDNDECRQSTIYYSSDITLSSNQIKNGVYKITRVSGEQWYVEKIG